MGSRHPEAAGEDASEHHLPKRAMYTPVNIVVYADFDAMGPCVEIYFTDTHAHIHHDIRVSYFFAALSIITED